MAGARPQPGRSAPVCRPARLSLPLQPYRAPGPHHSDLRGENVWPPYATTPRAATHVEHAAGVRREEGRSVQGSLPHRLEESRLQPILVIGGRPPPEPTARRPGQSRLTSLARLEIQASSCSTALLWNSTTFAAGTPRR